MDQLSMRRRTVAVFAALTLLAVCFNVGAAVRAPSAAPSRAPVSAPAVKPHLQPGAAQVLSPSLLPPMSPTELEVLEDRGPDFRYWRTEMPLELSGNQYLMTRPFRWKTTAAGVKSAVWQVALFPYPTHEKEWQSPPGLLAHGTATTIPKPGEYAEFSIDFRTFAPLFIGSAKAFQLQPGARPRVIGGVTASTTPRAGTSRPAPSASTGGAATGPRASISAAETGQARAAFFKANPADYAGAMKTVLQYTLPVRYYIRLVTLGRDGNPVGNPSLPVVVTLDKPQPLPDAVAKSLAMDGKHPAVRLVSYQPFHAIQPNFQYHVVVTRDVPANSGIPWGWDPVPKTQKLLYWKGEKLDLTPPPDKPKSAWDQFLDDLGATADFFASAVNWVSTAWNDIKAAIVNLIASALGDWAKGPLMAALDAGLVALGVPPSIPNFSELCSTGQDYLIAEVADQAGIPEDVAQQAVHTMIDAAKKAEDGGGSSLIWYKPDPDYLDRKAVLIFRVSNPTSEPTDSVTLQIRTHTQKDDVFPFLPKAIPLPPLAPGKTVDVPVCLDSNWGPLQPGGPTRVAEWEQEYSANGQMQLEVWTEWQQGGYFPKRHVWVEQSLKTAEMQYGKGIIPPMPHGGK